MKISTKLNTDYNKKITDYRKTENQPSTNDIKEDCNTITRNSDSITFSSTALKYIKGSSNVTVLSGSDILEAYENSEKNKVSIYFGDSSILNRTVKRGYVEIDGKKITLSDKIKETLRHTDKIAQESRESAFAEYTDKQYKALMDKTDNDIKAFGISAKMSNGTKVSAEEESLLLKSDPQMYLMATIAQHQAKIHKKGYGDVENKVKISNENLPKEFTSYKVKFDFDKSTESIISNSVDIEAVTITV